MALSEFLAGVLGKISDPEKRAQAEALLSDATAAEAVQDLQNGYLRQSEFSRKMDGVRKAEEEAEAARLRADGLYHQNVDWFTQNKALLEQAKTGGTTTPTPTPAPAGAFTREDVNKAITEALNSYTGDVAAGMSETSRMTLQHYQQFGEVLDPAPLIGRALKEKRLLVDVYQDQYKDRLAQKAQEAEATRVAALKAEWEADFRKQHPNLPYQVRPSASLPETLDGLKPRDPNAPSEFSADAAAELYHQLVAGKA